MFSHRVSEYFGDFINVERVNTDIVSVSSTHYGDVPWSKDEPKFASVQEKYEVYKDGRHAKRTEPLPAYCTSHVYKRFFRIKEFKAATTAPSVDKPERKRT